MARTNGVKANDPNFGDQQRTVGVPARPDAKDVRPGFGDPNATGGRPPQTGGGGPTVPGYGVDDKGRRVVVDKFGNQRSTYDFIPSYSEAQAQAQRRIASQNPAAYQRLRYQQPVTDDNLLVVEPPTYSAEQVGKAEPELIARYKEMLWNKYQQLPAAERNSSFWRQVRANPEGAATSLVQRLYTNAQMFQSGSMPKLNEAMKARIEQSDIYKLVSFIDYADKNF